MELDKKIETLVESLTLSNSPWSAWELEFIESVGEQDIDGLSDKQVGVIEKLWDKL